jgi:hypothetical protein
VKKIIFIFIILATFTSFFAHSGVNSEGVTKKAQLFSDHRCKSGFLLKAKGIESCAQIATRLKLGTALTRDIVKMKKTERKNFELDPLAYFSEVGPMRFTGKKSQGEAEFIISKADVISRD